MERMNLHKAFCLCVAHGYIWCKVDYVAIFRIDETFNISDADVRDRLNEMVYFESNSNPPTAVNVVGVNHWFFRSYEDALGYHE